MLLPDKDPRDLYIGIWENWFTKSASFLRALDPEARNFSQLRIEDRDVSRLELVKLSDTHGLHLIVPGSNRLRFDVFWSSEAARRMLGNIVLIDSVYTGSRLDGYIRGFKSVLSIVSAYSPFPCLVAAYGANHPDAWSPDDLRIILKIDQDVPIIPFDVLDRESVKNVILQLLCLQLAQIEQLEAEAE